MAAALGERGAAMLDAPVSGDESGAVEGMLSIMVGGDAAVLDQVRGVLECLGSTITHVGPTGAGEQAANKLIVAANIQAVAEAIVMLESAGADVAGALDAIDGGLAGSAVLERKRPAFLNDDSPRFPGEAAHVHDTAREAGISLPTTALVSHFMALEAQGHAELDYSVLLRVARRLNDAAKGAAGG